MSKSMINGLVRADGSIDAGGSGFTVEHPGAGQYLLTFPSGTFTGDGAPALTVTQRNPLERGVNVLVPYIDGENRAADGSIVFDIRFSPVLGTFVAYEDSGFDFIAVG